MESIGEAIMIIVYTLLGILIGLILFPVILIGSLLLTIFVVIGIIEEYVREWKKDEYGDMQEM